MGRVKMTSNHINMDINGFYGPKKLEKVYFLVIWKKIKNPRWRRRPSWKWPPPDLCRPFREGHGGYFFHLTPQDDKTSEKLTCALRGHGTYRFDPTIKTSDFEKNVTFQDNKIF